MTPGETAHVPTSHVTAAPHVAPSSVASATVSTATMSVDGCRNHHARQHCAGRQGEFSPNCVFHHCAPLMNVSLSFASVSPTQGIVCAEQRTIVDNPVRIHPRIEHSNQAKHKRLTAAMSRGHITRQDRSHGIANWRGAPPFRKRLTWKTQPVLRSRLATSQSGSDPASPPGS